MREGRMRPMDRGGDSRGGSFYQYFLKMKLIYFILMKS